MRRLPSTPRPGWRATVESQGLVFPTTVHADGSQTPYWDESACYELTAADVEHLETVTEQLHRMAVQAGEFLATGAMGDLGLPAGALRLAGQSLAADPVSIYGRFDLHYDGTRPAVLLEYNADTPTGLVESSVAQWYWLDDVHPQQDQFNSLHERLVAAWRRHAHRFPGGTVHFAHSGGDSTGEEWMTVAYLRDTAVQAGLTTVGLQVDDLGWDRARRRFVDLDGRHIGAAFVLYPWEDMLREPFGQFVAEPGTQWIEPLWKVLLSNKALLAALWHLYPGHDNLLPAHLADAPPPSMTEWAAKPLHGREGAGVRLHAGGVDVARDGGRYGPEGYVFQEFRALPSYDGNHAVVGSWVVDGMPAGVGIRESDGLLTDFDARFVPHYLAAPRPDGATQAEWIAGDHQAEHHDAAPPRGGACSPT